MGSHTREKGWGYPPKKTACQSGFRFKRYKPLKSVPAAHTQDFPLFSVELARPLASLLTKSKQRLSSKFLFKTLRNVRGSEMQDFLQFCQTFLEVFPSPRPKQNFCIRQWTLGAPQFSLTLPTRPVSDATRLPHLVRQSVAARWSLPSEGRSPARNSTSVPVTALPASSCEPALKTVLYPADVSSAQQPFPSCCPRAAFLGLIPVACGQLLHRAH